MSLPNDPTPTRKAIVASLVAENMTLEGSLSGDGELQIDGTIKGDVRVARVSIGENGTVEGSVHAESVEIRGRVAGEVSAKQVRLYNTAHVDGDITHEQLAMEVGAFFQGRSMRLQRPAGQVQPALTSSASATATKPSTPEPTRDAAAKQPPTTPLN